MGRFYDVLICKDDQGKLDYLVTDSDKRVIDLNKGKPYQTDRTIEFFEFEGCQKVFVAEPFSPGACRRYNGKGQLVNTSRISESDLVSLSGAYTSDKERYELMIDVIENRYTRLQSGLLSQQTELERKLETVRKQIGSLSKDKEKERSEHNKPELGDYVSLLFTGHQTKGI